MWQNEILSVEKQEENWQMFMQHIDWVYSDWTLDVSWYVMECKS